MMYEKMPLDELLQVQGRRAQEVAVRRLPEAVEEWVVLDERTRARLKLLCGMV